jgi:uncharacterized heparinase superfamily protein
VKKRLHRLSWTTQLKYRWLLRRAVWSQPAIGLVTAPEPWTIGDFERGQQLVSGKILITGHMMDVGENSIWSQSPPSELFATELQGFGWLDDLAALGDQAAKYKAQSWVLDWISGFGMGKGPGWSADLTGRRMIRWINHSAFLLNRLSRARQAEVRHSMAIQTLLLAKSWRRLQPGRPRFEALSALVGAAQSLDGMGSLLTPALSALALECKTQIDVDGGITSRNPEELLKIFGLLTWVKQTLNLSNTPIPEVLATTITTIAPVLRSLRHGDGTLVRFHGGAQGSEYVLDQALAISEVRPSKPRDEAMGFVRLSAGVSSLIVDAGMPPSGSERFGGHASTCAFELSVGRNVIIVNCGSGLCFGADWHLAGRVTASHATLGINGLSSSAFAPAKKGKGRALKDAPDTVTVHKTRAVDGMRLKVSHNGYQSSHGLVHARTLDLPVDSKGLVGEDELYALNTQDVKRFFAIRRKAHGDLYYSVRFHLHPDVAASLESDGASVSLTLINGDIWVFRYQGLVELSLEESVYFEEGRVHPRPTAQIVLTSEIKEITTRVRWSLAKASENPQKAA